MLVLRSSSALTTHNYWTQRTLQPDNCHVPKHNYKQSATTFKLSSLYHNYSRIPTALTTTTKDTTIPATVILRPLQEPINIQHHLNAQFLSTVIQKLPFLMNEIRTKKNFSSIINNCSPFTNKKQHHLRQQASKSNKVFLRYTPRDPRLRFYKHSASELSEYLCNYGELIGGSSIISFSVPNCRSKFSKQLRYGDKIFVKNSSYIYGERTKKNYTQLLTSV